MKRFINKKVAAIAAAVGLTLGIGGAAFAYWTSSGSGTGTSSTTTGSSDLTYSTTTINAMYPGDSPQDFTVTVTNNSTTQAEYVNDVHAWVTTSAGSSCDGSNFLLDGNPAPSTSAGAVALDWTGTELAANGGNAPTAGDDTIQFNDELTNQNDCKNVTVTLHYSSSL